MKRHIVLWLLTITLVGALFSNVTALAATDNPVDMPYESYVYNRDGEPLNIPSPYVIEKTVTGTDIGVGEFSDLSDVFFDGIDRLYFADTGNNRIVVTDKDYRLINTIATFNNGEISDSLATPQGVFANGEKVYVADSGNSRIVVFGREKLEYLYTLDRPDIAILEESYKYTPNSITVDNAGRIYVIADGINQGLICLSEKGEFHSFLGAPTVEYDFLDLLWRKFTTKEQQKQTQQFVPTEYTKMLIDKRGFIYAVAASSSSTPVTKLNSQGDNVLSELDNESDYGDITYTTMLGAPKNPSFCDITIDNAETYYLLDSQNGRIYAYSSDGYLLFVFGGTGSQTGTFYSASSIQMVDNQLLVTDRIKNAVCSFELTDFGQSILSALSLYDKGDYEAAEKMWKKVYDISSNYTLAIVGLAKIDVQKGDYDAAMEKVKPIRAYKVYSKAFAQWRDMWIRDHFGMICFILIAAVVVLVFVVKWCKKFKFAQKIFDAQLYKEYKYADYVMFHPFDGFWDIKREKRGSVRGATLILVLFSLIFAVRAQFTGYTITKTASTEQNAIFDVIMILLPLALWIVSNWCFTALMDGEGNMKDIYIATCYALKPYIWFGIPLFLMSHVVTAEEVVIYTVFDTICWIWVLGLVFFGMMVTHDYSLSKSLLTTVLTLVGICLIVFIMLLFTSIIQEVYTFFNNAYQELVFRTY